MAAITTRDLVKKFGPARALDGLDLTVGTGEIHGFLGPNGAGKSTTIRILLGLMRADSGRAEVLGGDPWADATELHRRLAYVPGDVELWPNLTGGEAIDLLGRLRGGLDETRRAELIERFQLDPTKKSRTYSKGNRQKVALVAAFAADVELLILDEPTSGLDPLMEAIFQEIVAETRAAGRTVLLSSHILSQVEKLADRVSIIRQGKIVQAGTLAELRHLTRTTVEAVTAAPVSGLAALPGVHNAETEHGQVRFSVDAEHLDGAIKHLGAFGIRALTSPSPHIGGAHAAPLRQRSSRMTATTVGRVTAAAPSGAFKGTGAMLRLALRRDRVKLPTWTLGIALFLPYFASVANATNPTAETLRASAKMMDVPMLRLFSGPMFGMENPTVLKYLVNAYFPEFLLGAALMSMLLIARHTRAEEQSGRAELVRAAVVGRQAALTAALLVSILTNVLLALLLTAAGVGVGMTPGDALLFGAATAAMGLVFAAVTSVSVQLTEHSRAAVGIAGAVLAVVWLLRAVGAVQDIQGGWLTWLSPMGWAQLTRVADDGRWWPLALAVLLSTALAAVAYALSARRDLGAGLVASRPGRARAARGLRSPLALAFRLQRASILWWGGSLIAAGLVFGGLAGSMREGVAEEILGGGADVVGGYLSLMAVGMSFLVGIFTAQATTRLRAEENRGRVTPLLATPTSRWAWLGSSLLATGLAAVALLMVSGLSMAAGTALALDDATRAGAAAAAVLARTPEILFLLGVAATLFGLAPRAVPLTWAVLALGVVVRFWGADLPGWARGLSPFDHIPRLPVEDFRLAPLVMLTALAAGLLLLGLYGFRSRDLKGA